MKKFLTELFQDDVHEFCIGRFSLFMGLILTAFTATIYMDAEGEFTWAEAALRASPGIIGLLAYVFTRLYESKEWCADLAKSLSNKTKGSKND